MEVVNKHSVLWAYLSENQRGLILDGENLLELTDELRENVSDYSFLVFPFSKAYEGFLKKFFLDLKIIKEDEYYGDEIRIGRILNPHYLKKKHSAYLKLCGHEKGGKDLSDRLWKLWRRGRNQVFHYFPHNFRKLSYDEALEIIKDIAMAMEDVTTQCDLAVVELAPTKELS